MSLAALADDEILRTDRAKLDLAPVIDPHLQTVFGAFHLDTGAERAMREAVKPLAAASPIQKTPGSNALDGLVKYVPTESVTLYIAATAAMSSLTATFPSLTPYSLYWSFVGLTPILFLLIYVGKRRSQKLAAFPQKKRQWPWWSVIASTIAFMVWALAVPPLVTTDAGKIVAGFGALLVSTLLSLLGAVFEPVDSTATLGPHIPNGDFKSL